MTQTILIRTQEGIIVVRKGEIAPKQVKKKKENRGPEERRDSKGHMGNPHFRKTSLSWESLDGKK